ncbi:MAG: MmgE/PrpD family protein [Pseudomonadota bacterium]
MATHPEREQAAEQAKQLYAWAAQACSRPLPEPVRRRAATILADDIGAITVGSREPQVLRAREAFARQRTSAIEATVFAPGAPRWDRAAAACANGMAIAWAELDEGFRNAACHAGAYSLPALMAEAEACGASVDQILRAVAVAYELTTRFAIAFRFPGFYVHPHAVYACLGAAAAVSLVRGHDAKTLQDTVTGAASMSFAGPFDTAVEGSLVRNAWTAAGAWVGMRAADWAEAGIAGGIHTPYDVFVTNFRTRCDPNALSAGLGEQWSVMNGYHKIYACCNYAHAAVEASLQLRAQLGSASVDDIEAIRVEAGPGGVALNALDPPTVLSAKFSIPHAAAATAVMGTGGAAAFTEAALHDERVARLRHRVTLAAYEGAGPPPNDRPAQVTWSLRDGRTLSAFVKSPRGGADQPFDEPTLLAKLEDNTRAVLPAARSVLEPIIAGDGQALARSWRDTVSAIAIGAIAS